MQYFYVEGIFFRRHCKGFQVPQWLANFLFAAQKTPSTSNLSGFKPLKLTPFREHLQLIQSTSATICRIFKCHSIL
jgi:hypothetical protein